ncbi:hypothetical protein D3C80_1502470 [compost metagenome]
MDPQVQTVCVLHFDNHRFNQYLSPANIKLLNDFFQVAHHVRCGVDDQRIGLFICLDHHVLHDGNVVADRFFLVLQIGADAGQHFKQALRFGIFQPDHLGIPLAGFFLIQLLDNPFDARLQARFTGNQHGVGPFIGNHFHAGKRTLFRAVFIPK